MSNEIDDPTREELLKGAQVHMSNARSSEESEAYDQAEEHWRHAERLYEAAGLDADWFTEGPDKRPIEMNAVEIMVPHGPVMINTGKFELTTAPEDPDAEGIVVPTEMLREPSP